MEKPEITFNGLPKDIIKALKVAEKTISKNKLDIDLKIVVDFTLDCYGIHEPTFPNQIKINPHLFMNTSKEELNAPFYTSDFSMLAVFIHEFCHLLDFKLNIHAEYCETFPEKFSLNGNGSKNRKEEIAEIMGLYILNPYFLRLINKDIYDFLKTFFESPKTCNKVSLHNKWKKWSKEVKEDCFEKWGVKFVNGVLKNRLS